MSLRGLGADKPKMRVLIVDDEPLIGRALERHFSKRGWVVRVAPSVADAAKAVRENVWDLVLLDVTLPDGSGLSLVDHVRETGFTRILLITGESAASLPEGVDAILHKPFDPPALERSLQALWPAAGSTPA